MSKKYSVRACINCDNYITDKKTRERSCKDGRDETLQDWLSTSGRKRQADHTLDDDLECFVPNKRVKEMEKNQALLSSFMDDLNAMLNQ